MAAGRQSDIPLSRDASARFLPWIVAFLTYIAALSVAGFLALNQLSVDWNDGLSNAITVEVTAAEGEEEDSVNTRVQNTVALLRGYPGVEKVEVLARAQIREFLEPWLGNALDISALPLPRLIDVKLASGTDIDVAALNERLATTSGARADDHAVWRDRMERFLGSLEWAAIAIVAVVVAAAVIMVAFATRGSLATHRETIELLHLIGARDEYIARQFQRHAMRLALLGSMLGALAAMGTAFLISQSASGLATGAGLPTDGNLMPVLATLALPPVSTLVALITARRTVLAALQRMT
ncbi:cell division protein FtsX [Hwanghaeella sp.]|uniref:cell division protein FtsX n=1 Tax=Hwanghaeella sp. TaxID=2605943 RepID=UPI003CCB8A27